MGVGDDAGNNIHEAVHDAAMAGMLDLRDILELIVDRFDNESLTQDDSVNEGHEPVLHIFPHCGDELESSGHERFKQAF